MTWLAWKMLTADRGKYFALVLGVAFATFLMAQQVSLFIGVMRRGVSRIEDVRDADVWVMDPKVRHADEAPGLPEGTLARVRGVAGVGWAVRFYQGSAGVRLGDGNYRNCVLLGLDDGSLVGAPRELVAGGLADLRRPDAVVVDQAGHEYLWPGRPYQLGRAVQINGRRAVLVGVCKASAPYITQAVLYTRYSLAGRYVPHERCLMNFVLVKAQPGWAPEEVCRRIRPRTGLSALSREQFIRKTVCHYLRHTGIPLNFGITIALGFLIGAAVCGQTFYLFVLENLPHFGLLKAMGVSDGRVLGMVLAQGAGVAGLGYGLGIGLTALFFTLTSGMAHLSGLFLYWQAMAGVAAAVALVVVAVGLLGARRVFKVEPAVVFRG